jgi:predicted nucleic acid-binding protein
MTTAGAVPRPVVIDANVAVKWYVPEVHEAEAKRFLDPGFELHVPDLLFTEFGNIVWKKARLLKAPELTEQDARDIVRHLLSVSLTAHPTALLLTEAVELALGSQRSTVYDCCYLALARTLGCRLVTADRTFYDAHRGGGDAAHLLWVADPIV